MHAIVNLRAARSGHLEQPAVSRRNLSPKVAIGAQWQPRKRETLDIRGGTYKGYNPAMGADAARIQQAMLAPSLCEFTPKPVRRERRWKQALWWLLSGVLLTLLVFMCIVMEMAPKY